MKTSKVLVTGGAVARRLVLPHADAALDGGAVLDQLCGRFVLEQSGSHVERLARRDVPSVLDELIGLLHALRMRLGINQTPIYPKPTSIQ